MSDIETAVSRWMHHSVEEPPHLIDAEAITGVPATGARLGKPLAASVLVVVLAVGSALAFHDGRHIPTAGTSGTSTATSSPTASSMVGTLWHLVEISPNNPPAAAVAPITLELDPGGLAESDGCTYADYTVDGDRIDFTQPFAVLTTASDRSHQCTKLPLAQNDLIYAILRGSPTWAVTGDTLTITQPGVGTLRYAAPAPTSSADGPAFSSTSPNGTISYPGVGAITTPAPAAERPAIDRAQALAMLTSMNPPATIDGTLTSLRLVDYENAFTTTVNGRQVPEVPRQLVWLAEYTAPNSASSGTSLPLSFKPRPAIPPTGPATGHCYRWAALSATTGAVLDGFEYCGANPGP